MRRLRFAIEMASQWMRYSSLIACGAVSLLPVAGLGAAEARVTHHQRAYADHVATGVGFQTVDIPNGAEAPLKAGIWFPGIGQAKSTSLETFSQSVIRDGAVRGHGLPLVVISHGGGGSIASHYDTALALARAGFVVAAVDHAGDSFGDTSKVLQLWRRPQQLSRLVSYMLSEWSQRRYLDPQRVGAYGFSNGGFTVLVVAGGVPNLSLIDPYCRAHPTQDLCAALLAANIKSVGSFPVPPDAWRTDKRIRAIAVAAPGFAPTLANGGLRNVRLPVQLWYGDNDQHQPGPWYGQLVLRELPTPPELHVVKGAGHYDFLAPCSAVLARAVPLICTEAEGFDRSRFHQRLNDDLTRFFRQTLSKRSR